MLLVPSGVSSMWHQNIQSIHSTQSVYSQHIKYRREQGGSASASEDRAPSADQLVELYPVLSIVELACMLLHALICSELSVHCTLILRITY